MKVYIVMEKATWAFSGERIAKVFVNKEKAIKYEQESVSRWLLEKEVDE